MEKKVIVFAALLFVAACATPATNVAATPAAPQANAEMAALSEEELNVEVCRRVQQTGTRFHRTECKTRGEWIEEMQDAQDATRAMQRETAPRSDCLFNDRC